MSGIELVITLIPLGIGSIAYALRLHKKYKNEKKGIYAMIRKGLDELDFDLVAEWANKLKIFDEKHTNLLSGLPKKSITQRIFRKSRSFKMDDVERLFNVSKEVILDATKLKFQFDNDTLLDKGKVILAEIDIEEKKESETLQVLKIKLEKIKRKQIASNNQERKVIDNFNLTDKICNLHKDYENLFVETFEAEHDLENIMKRGMKKQMLLKKMKKISEKQSNNNQKSQVSC